MSLVSGSTIVKIGADKSGLPLITNECGNPLDAQTTSRLMDTIELYYDVCCVGSSTPVPKPVKQHRRGIVYLIEGHGCYKIGLTTKAESLLPRYLKLPFEVTLIHTIHTSDVDVLERYWHSRFADKRGNGEWFNLLPDDVADFCAHESMEVVA